MTPSEPPADPAAHAVAAIHALVLVLRSQGVTDSKIVGALLGVAAKLAIVQKGPERLSDFVTAAAFYYRRLADGR